MPNTPPSTATRPAESVAEVRARDQVMRYRRAGVGRPLVVLHDRDVPNGVWPEVETELVAHYRVLTPELLATGVDVAAFISDFLEGVGVPRITLVATDTFCLAALELVLLNAEQVERLVLIPAGGAGDTGLDGALLTSVAGAPVPLLVVRRGLSSLDALGLLRHFLGIEHQPAG